MTAPRPIRNAALAASAGTGKTFALSNRYLGLLAAGADPASIVALTFTRKAAGEILARILTRLAGAAASGKGNRKLSDELAAAGLPVFAAHAIAQAALRELAHALPQLRIGTLDSFFLQILTPFRLEAGIGAELSIMQERENPEEDLVLQSLLERASLSADEKRELMEAFKLATFGEESKSIYASIQRLIRNQYELFQRAPDSAVWGNPARIWNGDTSLLQPPCEPDWPAVFDALEAQSQTLAAGRTRTGWDTFVRSLQTVSDGGDFEFNDSIGKGLYAAFSTPGGKRDSFEYYRKAIPLVPEAQKALASVFAYIRHVFLSRQIVRTRGLARLLVAYDREHRRQIIRTGQLTFNDIAQLLAPATGLAPAHLRTRLDCRLDARFLHWLLDEFQDTSLIQWAVMENLLDEVIQNADGDRTLFYVGDTKQAIYEWRNGDPRLFRRILGKYNRPGKTPAIQEPDPLVESWRSSPRILDAVNTVFGSLPDMPLPHGMELMDDWVSISREWQKEWQKPHKATGKNTNLAGRVTLHILPRPEKDQEDVPTPISRTVDLIEEFQRDIPEFERLSVAVLTRGNSDGIAMQAALAVRGIRSVWAGDTRLLDNTLIPAILSFIKLIEHPGDTFARRHVEMSSLVPAISLNPEELAAWARLVREQGYAGLAARLAARLDLAEAPFEHNRLRMLMDLAADFDRQPASSALAFVSCITSQKVQSGQSGTNVQILTMHKAKGLEFDIVILPSLGSRGITSMGKEPLLVHEQDGNEPIPPVDWILASPETKVMEAEPVLAAQYAEDRRGKALEELRLLYVAMTRAKRALHLLTVAPPAKTSSLRLDNILQNTLAPGAAPNPSAPVRDEGDPQWWKQKSDDEKPAAPPSAPLDFTDLPQVSAPPPLESHIASQEDAGGEGTDGRHFRPEGFAARDLGTRVHAIFEQIEWLAPAEVPEFGNDDPEAVQLVTAFLKKPDHHRFFEKNASVELLREQAFEAVLNGKWLSGMIDRLHLERDAAGKPVRAQIIDYKTDRTTDPARHRPQMDDYRQAVALLFGLPPENITCTLLFVRTGEIASS